MSTQTYCDRCKGAIETTTEMFYFGATSVPVSLAHPVGYSGGWKAIIKFQTNVGVRADLCEECIMVLLYELVVERRLALEKTHRAKAQNKCTHCNGGKPTVVGFGKYSAVCSMCLVPGVIAEGWFSPDPSYHSPAVRM